jgi:hypothetical protein
VRSADSISRVAQATRPQHRVVAEQPDHSQRQRAGQSGDRHDIDRTEARATGHAPHQQEHGGERCGGEGEAEQADVLHKALVRAHRSGSEPPGHDHPADQEQGRRDPDARNEDGGARPSEHAEADRDQHDAHREERRLALERGGALGDVGHGAGADEHQDQAGEDMHSRDYRLRAVIAYSGRACVSAPR